MLTLTRPDLSDRPAAAAVVPCTASCSDTGTCPFCCETLPCPHGGDDSPAPMTCVGPAHDQCHRDGCRERECWTDPDAAWTMRNE